METHLWQSSEERHQWECLRCGATVPHEVTASTPKADHMDKANHPGSAPHIVAWVRSQGDACHGGVITPEQHGEAIKMAREVATQA